jgi:hypothetical protein
MTAREQKRPVWLTADCPAWCEQPGWHKDSDRYADRRHSGKPVYVDLTAEEPPMAGESPKAKVFDDPEFATVYLLQHYREAEPRIWVGKGETNEGIHLTLAEAEQLAGQLRARVDEAAKR